jgi:predicted ABC-type ATPase
MSIEHDIFGFIKGKPKAQGVSELFSIIKSRALTVRPGVEGIFDVISKGAGHKYTRREGTPGNYRYYYDEPGTDAGSVAETTEQKPVGSGELYDKLKSMGFVDRLDHLPAQTNEHHKGADGQYTPERQQLHAEIADSFLSKAQTVPDHLQPVAVVMMGGPGSGKSSTTEGMSFDDFVQVDPDAVKKQIPEYNEATEGKALNAAFMAHEESSDIAGQVKDRAIADRKNVLLDGTGKNLPKMVAMVERLKKEGYQVNVIMPHIPKQEGLERCAARAERTGRYVPDDIVGGAYDKIPYNFTQISQLADSAMLYDNSGPHGSPATLMWEKSADAPNGAVRSQSHWDSFQTYAQPYD